MTADSKCASALCSLPQLLLDFQFNILKKIKSSLCSPYCAEACNKLLGPSPQLSAWATQLRINVATVVSRWPGHCDDLTGPGIEPQTSRTDCVRLTTELMTGSFNISVVNSAIFKSPSSSPQNFKVTNASPSP